MTSILPTLDGLDLTGKTVLVRADLNVPLRDGQIFDDTRLRQFLPTLHLLQQKNVKIIVMSHLGRPKGSVVDSLSLHPIVDELTSKSGLSFKLISLERLESLPRQEWPDHVVLENIRFYKGEEENDPNFAQRLAALGDIYVNDGFSVSHRAHASVEGVTHFLPSYAGPQVFKEVEALSFALSQGKRPKTAIIAGAKVSTKIGLLHSLSQSMDTLIIGGGLAHTFFAAQGYGVGRNALVEPDRIPFAKDLLTNSPAEVILPTDIKVADKIEPGAQFQTVPVTTIPDDKIIVDMGERSLERVLKILQHSKTLIWNGAIGIFEIPPFDQGTLTLARSIGELTQKGKLYSLVGGGETVAALNLAGVTHHLSHVSTAGGAFLEYIEGKALPGLEALKSEYLY